MEKTDSKQQFEVLDLTEEEKKKLTEDLIVTGKCSYSFKVLNVPVEIVTLNWKDQKSLTSKLASIPKKVGDRDITLAEYSALSTEIVLTAQLSSFNNKTDYKFDELSSPIIRAIVDKIGLLNNTIISLVSFENLTS